MKTQAVFQMKTLTLIYAAIIFCANSLLAQGWECEDCPKRDLALFDLDIWQREMPEEGSGLDPDDWVEMFMVARGIADALFNEDPSSECINFYDGQMALINEWSEDSWNKPGYSHGYYSLSLPPIEGTSKGMEYLLSGSIVMRTNGGYNIHVYVQTGETGERVTEATMPYNLAVSGVQNGKNIAKKIMPIMQRIRDFERKRRDEESEIVIGPDASGAELKIEPEKEKIKGSESTKVEIKVIDCDGVPLKDMSVKLSSDGGSFDPEKVETDENGIGESTFTADCDPGEYQMTMEFNARYPFSHDENTFGEIAKIKVEASDKFDLIYKHTMTLDYHGGFLLQSDGSGRIPCTINWDADPPSIKGDGTVKATWTGNADECKFEGKSTFNVTYEGKVVYSENGDAMLEVRKTSESDQGGNFKIICKNITQTVPASMPFPVVEEDRILKFGFKDGKTSRYDIEGGNYCYTINIKCK